ncbi:MAG: hypothetical protein R6V85_14340 [Polyangia bacterium]
MTEQQPTGGGELTQYESMSAITPKKQPLAIIIGTLLLPLVLWVINLLAPTEAVEDLKEGQEEESDKAAQTATDNDLAEEI